MQRERNGRIQSGTWKGIVNRLFHGNARCVGNALLIPPMFAARAAPTVPLESTLAALHHHASVQLGNRFTPGRLKRDRQHRVNKAGEAGFE